MARKKKEDIEKNTALAAWRKEHWKKVMDDNNTTLVTIRDDTDVLARTRVEAAKTLARMVDGLSPEKITVASVKAAQLAADSNREQTLTEDDKKEIDEAFGLDGSAT